MGVVGKRKRGDNSDEDDCVYDRFLYPTDSVAAAERAYPLPPPPSTLVGPSTSFTAVRSLGYHAMAMEGDAGPSTPRKRAKKDPESPLQEKRLARWKNSCPLKIQERVERVMTQRFYLVDRDREGDELKETFKVLGSTGNIYTVMIDKMPSCNCPDALKGNHCKHILFVFLKVLNVSSESSYYYQKALLSTELAEIFNAAPSAPTVIAAERIRQAFIHASCPSTSAAPAAAAKRLPQEGNDCPICYESMPPGEEEGLVFCPACGNGLHRGCFEQWGKTPNGRTCVICRAEWRGERDTVPGADVLYDGRRINDEGYINIAGPAGISPVRDTSSYYNGPARRGSRRAYSPELYDDY
ncbi:hypothetical protein DACRYDRAFT_118538 [Dacryopinax primogenitus]|uniref:SWIM-type domain-containing protein n=1 Tax=Dacryopinax primogenitus (strain DJM 731) TaxID=1858805 RepID=M5FYV8_DACPD|nr:uncharacterized protein DACRYDRAFT_118538 [Dacryopinax primogenitus]EJT98751.1 hypothetical protein DACRYDRAFT_118538 [Dacryopinax primogenitus]